MKDLTDELTTATDSAQNFWQQDLADTVDAISWQYKSCVYHRKLFNWIDVPAEGYIVQLGVGYGLSLEILASRFGDRVIGFDIFNHGNHPLVEISDVRNLKDMPIAYVHCNVGNFYNTQKLRKVGLEWCFRNLVSGGVCLTSGGNDFVETQLGFTISSVADKYNCKVEQMPNDPSFIEMTQQGRYNHNHECLVIKQ